MPRQKLEDWQYDEMIALYRSRQFTYQQLADKYGISVATVKSHLYGGPRQAITVPSITEKGYCSDNAKYYRLLSENVKIGFAEQIKDRELNMNTIVFNGYGPCVLSRYIKPNILCGNTSFVLFDYKGEALCQVKEELESKQYDLVVLDFIKDPQVEITEKKINEICAKLGHHLTAVFIVADNGKSNASIGLLYEKLLKGLYSFFNTVPVHVHFFMDEFLNAVPELFLHYLTLMNSRNMSASVIVPSYGALTQYVEDGAAIVGACDTMLCLGIRDIDTANFVSKMFGQTTGAGTTPRKTYFRPVTRKAVESKELLYGLGTEDVLVFVKGCQPCTDKYWSGKNSGQDKATSKEIPSGRDLTKISVICPSCNKVNEFPITDDWDNENRLRVEKHCRYCQAKILSLYL